MRIIAAALNSLHRLRHLTSRNVSVGEGSSVYRWRLSLGAGRTRNRVAIGRHSICGSPSSPAGPLKEARAEAGIAAHRAAITADAKARRFAATAAGLEAATAAVLMAAAAMVQVAQAAMVQAAEVVAMVQRRPILPGRPIVNQSGVRVAKSGRLRPPAAFWAHFAGDSETLFRRWLANRVIIEARLN